MHSFLLTCCFSLTQNKTWHTEELAPQKNHRVSPTSFYYKINTRLFYSHSFYYSFLCSLILKVLGVSQSWIEISKVVHISQGATKIFLCFLGSVRASNHGREMTSLTQCVYTHLPIGKKEKKFCKLKIYWIQSGWVCGTMEVWKESTGMDLLNIKSIQSCWRELIDSVLLTF